jgi:hypothetical protein
VVVDQSEVVLVPGRDDEHDHLVRAHQADLVDRRVRSGTSVRMVTPVHLDPVQSSTDRAVRAPAPASAGCGAAAQSGACVSAWSRTASATIGADVVQASAYRVVPSAA